MEHSFGSGSLNRLRGTCYCGAVHYEVADEFDYALNCHCSDCRRATGAAFKSFAGIAFEKLRIAKGADDLLVYGDPSDNHDIHCKTCGSLMYSVLNQRSRVHIALGSLVDEPGIRPTAHIFVGDKAGWFEIADSLPQYEGHIT